MIPAILHQIWLGDTKPSPFIEACVASMKRLHPEWEYRLHTDLSLLDDTELGTEGDRIRTFCHDVLGKLDGHPLHSKMAMQADLLRLVILYLQGGFYVDMDMYGLQPLDEFCCRPLVLMRLTRSIIGEGIIGAPPKSRPIWSVLRSYIRKEPEDGYISMNLHAHAQRFGWRAYDPEYFCPHTRFRDDQKYRYTLKTHTIHCWRQHEYDLNTLEEIGCRLRAQK